MDNRDIVVCTYVVRSFFWIEAKNILVGLIPYSFCGKQYCFKILEIEKRVEGDCFDKMKSPSSENTIGKVRQGLVVQDSAYIGSLSRTGFITFFCICTG